MKKKLPPAHCTLCGKSWEPPVRLQCPAERPGNHFALTSGNLRCVVNGFPRYVYSGLALTLEIN